jgi:hypothetical protein
MLWVKQDTIGIRPNFITGRHSKSQFALIVEAGSSLKNINLLINLAKKLSLLWLRKPIIIIILRHWLVVNNRFHLPQ